MKYNKLWNTIRVHKPKLNKFDLSYERKLSLNMGSLVPVMMQEILPGDKFRVNAEMMMRLAPMLAPVMHRVNVHCHYFFVPNRLIWSEWEKFITGGADGQQNAVHPYVSLPNHSGGGSNLSKTGSLADYLGIPPYDGAGAPVASYNFNALPFRAYQLIYDQYYRDQTLEAPLDISLASGEVTGAERAKILDLRQRNWEKDYLTSALPWAQRGLASSAPVDYTDGQLSVGVNSATGAPLPAGDLGTDASGNVIQIGPATGVRLETPASVLTSSIRRAQALERWLEKNARAGSRYVENLLIQFGVISSDARLQRVEMLGGYSAPVVMSEVLSSVQFEGTTSELPQGNMAGHGIAVANRNGFTRRFEEHGFVVGILSVLPRIGYVNGADRMWFRDDRFDYFWRDFAHIGEQGVMKKEVCVDYTNPVDETVPFGYQSRYAEYKFNRNTVHGEMRNSLDYWHMNLDYSTVPALNENFVRAIPTKRIFAVEDEAVHSLYCQLYTRVDALRPIPLFSDPI